MKLKLQLLAAMLLCALYATGQNIALYEQFNGRYDFTFVGNTLNPSENNVTAACNIFTSSSASLALTSGDVIERAYLYWAGSGTGEGNMSIFLNGQPVTAQRDFPLIAQLNNTPATAYFSAFANVTSIVQATGNGNYTVSGLDLTQIVNTPAYCDRKTNFGGWAIVVFYRNENLPLNQINLYDGLQYVPNAINITLSSINVIDSDGAKIGFLAWEGDKNLDDGESLTFNGYTLSNALNPPTNAFNGTNSVTGDDTLYNMDLDVYEIQDYISPGDEVAQIALTSEADFVMINTIITKLNSQLPDATVAVNNVAQQCFSDAITIDYTVFNVNSTAALPAGTAVSVYVQGVFIMHFVTQNTLPIGGSESGSLTITLPANTPDVFTLKLEADSLNGVDAVKETNEDNNVFLLTVTRPQAPPLNLPEGITTCNEGFGLGTFDLTPYEDSLKNNPNDVVRFYLTEDDAEQDTDQLTGLESFVSTANPQVIYIRLQDAQNCFTVGSLPLSTKPCPPETFNYVTPNNDGINDTFFVKGLRNIFLNFKMSIYNRWGSLVWTGNHNTPDWDGIANEEKVGPDNKSVPTGTYYFVLELNDPNYPDPITGWVYVTR